MPTPTYDAVVADTGIDPTQLMDHDLRLEEILRAHRSQVLLPDGTIVTPSTKKPAKKAASKRKPRS